MAYHLLQSSKHQKQDALDGKIADTENLTYLDIRIAFHDFLDSGERERGMSVVRRFILGRVNLPLPE